MEENKFIWKIINRHGWEYLVKSNIAHLSINKDPEWIFITKIVDGEEKKTYIRREDVFMISFEGPAVSLKKEE